MLDGKRKIKAKNPLLWIFEALEDDPRYVLRKLFSFDAAYLDGRLYLAVAGGKEPWNGMMVCTSHEHHASIRKQFPQLAPHEVLGKWVFISRSLTRSLNPSRWSLRNWRANAIQGSGSNRK